jgi:hypothetical protein
MSYFPNSLTPSNRDQWSTQEIIEITLRYKIFKHISEQTIRESYSYDIDKFFDKYVSCDNKWITENIMEELRYNNWKCDYKSGVLLIKR